MPQCIAGDVVGPCPLLHTHLVLVEEEKQLLALPALVVVVIVQAVREPTQEGDFSIRAKHGDIVQQHSREVRGLLAGDGEIAMTGGTELHHGHSPDLQQDRPALSIAMQVSYLDAFELTLIQDRTTRNLVLFRLLPQPGLHR